MLLRLNSRIVRWLGKLAEELVRGDYPHNQGDSKGQNERQESSQPALPILLTGRAVAD